MRDLAGRPSMTSLGGRLMWSERRADTSVAEDFPWMAIVADQLTLLNAANLVLRTDYGLTDVPLPQDLGPATRVRLVK